MPPEEQTARRILADAFQHYARGPLNPAREAELRDLIATAIREAVVAEREGCAEAAMADADFDGLVAARVAGRYIAAAIRARSEA